MFGYIYKTTNLNNGKIYIGQRRGNFNSSYYGSGTILLLAIKKHGTDSFKVELIKSATNSKSLDSLEKKYIKSYKELFPFVETYNIADGGLNHRTGSGRNHPQFGKGGTFKGKKHSKETRRKISLSKLGKTSWNKGLKFSDEVRENMSKAHLGWVPPKAWRDKKSKSMMGNKLRLGSKAWNKGIPRTPEERLAMSEGQLRRIQSENVHSN